MAQPKIYAGPKLRETRARLGLTQKNFAERLGVSLPYLNQMENNNRPVSGGVIRVLADDFDLHVNDLSFDEAERTVVELQGAIADPLFATALPPMTDMRLIASGAPAMAHAFLELHRAYRTANQRLALLETTLARQAASTQVAPRDEVNDFFGSRTNYFDTLDTAAERFGAASTDTYALAATALTDNGYTITILDTDEPARRDGNTIRLPAHLPQAEKTFILLRETGLTAFRGLIGTLLDGNQFRSTVARDLAETELADYFAAAALMPYGTFARAARETRHDLERLAGIFGTTVEHAALRLSTLHRPGHKGVPFFFIRTDQDGQFVERNTPKRLHSVTPLVYQTFELATRFVRDFVETTDGARYLCVAKNVSQSGGRFNAPVTRQAIIAGCLAADAHDVIYSEGMDTTRT